MPTNNVKHSPRPEYDLLFFAVEALVDNLSTYVSAEESELATDTGLTMGPGVEAHNIRAGDPSSMPPSQFPAIRLEVSSSTGRRNGTTGSVALRASLVARCYIASSEKISASSGSLAGHSDRATASSLRAAKWKSAVSRCIAERAPALLLCFRGMGAPTTRWLGVGKLRDRDALVSIFEISFPFELNELSRLAPS